MPSFGRSWLKERGSASVSTEEIKALEQICAILEQREEDGFTDLNTSVNGSQHSGSSNDREKIYHSVTRDKLGYKRQDDEENLWFYLLPKAFEKVLCQGFDHKMVIRALAKRRFMIPEKESDGKIRYTHALRVPDKSGTQRAYRISSDILNWSKAEDMPEEARNPHAGETPF
jgi:hypothetical protein